MSTGQSHGLSSSGLLPEETSSQAWGVTPWTAREHPRILVWTWTEPDKPSGSPAILREILRRIPGGRVEVVCQKNTTAERRLPIAWAHPIRRVAFHRWLRLFPRRLRIRSLARYLFVLQCMLLYGLLRIRMWKPDCIYSIYMNDLWILSGYLLSRLTRIPIVYYVHDPYRERAEFSKGLSRWIATWLEPRALRHGHILVLSESLRERYLEQYGIEATVVRQLAGPPIAKRSAKGVPQHPPQLVIGFSGLVYANNHNQLRDLAEVCKRSECLRLRIWTGTRKSDLAEYGLLDETVCVEFEKDNHRLITKLAECHLLYLPLAFGGPGELPKSSLRYALPTKAVDYLRARVPILVHCPADYELARFFSRYQAAYHLAENSLKALEQWFKQWRENRLEPIQDAAMEAALEAFCPERNFQIHYQFLWDVSYPTRGD